MLLNADSYSGNTLGLAKKLLEYSQPRDITTGTLVALENLPDQLSPDCIGGTRSVRQRHRTLPWGRKQPQNIVDQIPGPRIIVILNG